MLDDQGSVAAMPTEEWHKLPDAVKVIAEKLAPEMVANFSERQLRNRSEKTAIEHSRRGLIAEVWHNYQQGDIKWWRSRWEETQEKGDDDGRDDKQGRGVKVILPWQEYVAVSDNRPAEQVVYELDEENNRIRRLGTFRRIDRQYVFKGDKSFYGVHRSSIK